MKIKSSFLFGIAFLFWACGDDKPKDELISAPVKSEYADSASEILPEEYNDRILGAFVGSAIGDAMGASTEMWSRKDIQRTFGYITTLTPAIRYQSPEGTWDHNLVAGATTDDTRWKVFMAHYLKNYTGNLNASKFSEAIMDYYKNEALNLRDEGIQQQVDALDSTLEKLDWMKEWARVAQAYQEGPQEYMLARDRFYGGEMSCAGMLYTPVFGLVTKSPDEAYRLAYEHTLFDLGYAKDIASLLAGMTQMAMRTQNMDSLINTAIFTDPYRFQDSRLVGRLSLETVLKTRDYVRRARLIPDPEDPEERDSLLRKMPKNYTGTVADWKRQEYIYSLLDKDQKEIPFHADEIWQILIAGLEFGQGDFLKTLQFIVNYGRDNDTVAAVAGFILGAQLGYENLPEKEKQVILKVNREQLGIDLVKVLTPLMVTPLK